MLRGHSSSVRDVAYSPSGRHIASAALDGDVKLWAAYTGSQVGNIQGHALPINKLIFSPTGKELITVSDDHKIKVSMMFYIFETKMRHITKTYLYNFDPLKLQFYIVKLGFTGVYTIFLNFAQKHRLWVLIRTASLRHF